MLGQLRLLRYLRPHTRDLTVVLLMADLGVAIDVLRPWPMKLLVDHVGRTGGAPHGEAGPVAAWPERTIG